MTSSRFTCRGRDARDIDRDSLPVIDSKINGAIRPSRGATLGLSLSLFSLLLLSLSEPIGYTAG
jgi:hypothetical protein